MPVAPRIHVKNAGPGSLAILSKLWHAQWYVGYTPESHHAYRMLTLTTPWARTHVQVLALEEDGRVRSGLIALSMTLTLAGKRRKVAGVAAVVTDPEQRGRGFAARLLTVAHRRFSDQGHHAAFLFTEIGTAYYAKLGYIPWPLVRHTLVPVSAALPRAVTFAPATPRDLAAQAALYDAMQTRFPVRFHRTRDYWRHMLARARAKDEVLASTGGEVKEYVSHRWIARARGEPVACARIVPREADLAVTEASYLPGHAGTLAALLAARAGAEDRAALSIVAPAEVVEELGFAVARREPVDKMMFAPLSGPLTARDLEPDTFCMWPEDWF
jgi:GNAT superfamily N-acetyltransferase